MRIPEGEENATHVGDGAYTWHDGYHVWLGTHDGHRMSNRVALEPTALSAFLELLEIDKKEPHD